MDREKLAEKIMFLIGHVDSDAELFEKISNELTGETQ